MAAKPKPDDALDRYLGNRFPTANPTLPRVAPDGTIVTPGHAYVPQEPGMGSGKGGTGDPDKPATPPAPPPAAPPLDWHAYLANWGFDQDIVDELDRIFRTYSDANQASAAALSYVRGTEWYTKTFPGIQEGMRKGIIGNEQDYRSYTNRLNDLYARYYGRNVSGDEVSKMLGKGYDVNRVGAQLGGEAYVKTSGADAQYLLGAFDEKGQANSDQLQSLGEEKSGLDSIVGQQLQDRLEKATQRFHGIFQGTLASPSMRLLGFGRLAAPSLQGGTSTSDVGS